MKSLLLILALLALPQAQANVRVLVGDCSGVLLKMEGMEDTQKALVLTDGHCIGMGSFMGSFPDAGELFLDVSVSGRVVVKKDREDRGEVQKYDKLIFATMTGVDLAVFQLNITYQDLIAQGYTIYTAAKELPPVGMALNFDSPNRDVNSFCEVEKITGELREGPWTWNQFARMKASPQCRYVHGQSGTAGIEALSQKIYALAQTGYEGGKPCSFNNVCEVSETGEISVSTSGEGYAVPVAGLYGCFDNKLKEFDFSLSTCALNFKRGK